MIAFYFKEAFKSIRRAKLSFLLSLISMSISVLLITISVIIIELSGDFRTRIQGELKFNIFLKDDLSGEQIDNIKKLLREKKYIEKIDFINKEKAAEIFIKETGEDFRKLLDYNPLPQSFSVTLKEDFFQKDSIKIFTSEIQSLKEVDEVIYHEEYINKILNLLEKIKDYIFIVTTVLLIISIYIVYSTVRLVTGLRMDELETMKLVGAKLSAIKTPIVINGMLIGFFAGIISLIIFSMFIFYFDSYIGVRNFFHYKNYYYLVILFLIGPLTGFLVSIFSLRKITLKV